MATIADLDINTVVDQLGLNFTLTGQQREALGVITKFLDPDNPERLCVIDGAAGTGKTTLLRICYQLYELMRFCAYTGKAANNLNLRIGANVAITIHKLVYQLEGETFDSKTGKSKPLYSPLPINLYGQRIGVDEYSLINEKDGQTLMDTYGKFLAVGDSFQLRPVEGNRWIKKFDYQLTEITRQAEDSGIIRQLHNIRYSRKGDPQKDDGVRIVKKLTNDHLMEADIILCYTNPRRHEFNRIVRGLQGRKRDVAARGELVVALENNLRYGLYNGSVYKLAKSFNLNDCGVPMHLELEGGEVLKIPRAIFVPEGCDKYAFTREERRKYDSIFDFGYCQTVHKSQGSEWATAALVNDYPADGTAWHSWLYTGFSRAKREVIYQYLR